MFFQTIQTFKIPLSLIGRKIKIDFQKLKNPSFSCFLDIFPRRKLYSIEPFFATRGEISELQSKNK